MKEWIKKEWLQYGLIILLSMGSYLVISLLGIGTDERLIKWGMTVLLLLIGGCQIIQWKKGKTDEEELCQAIILAGLVLRIGYMLYTGCEVRSHDLWEIDRNAYGHAAYLLTLMQERHLPTTNLVQLYQQPFFYMAGSVFSGIINGLLGNREAYALVDATKTVSCAASGISLVLAHQIFKECGLSGKGKRLALMITAFLPAYYLTGGRVNPDALATMFMLAAFLYTLRWMKKPDWKNTVILALIYGCGMMTKISVGVIALFTAALFLKKLFQERRKGKAGKLLLKYMVFGCISLPLGLWFSIRNYILFGQPLNYVLPIGDESILYRGNQSLFGRFLGIDAASLLKTPYVNLTEDYNLPVYCLKSALFGEFTWKLPGWVPVSLLFFAFVISICCCTALGWQILRNRKDYGGNLAAGMSLLYYGSIMVFYRKYPFVCSMDFRYMIFISVPLGILLGKYVNSHKRHNEWIAPCIYGFALFSCLMFAFPGFLF